MLTVSLVAVLSHLCIAALAAAPINLSPPTLSSSLSPRSPLTPLDSIDLVSPTGLHSGPPEVPWNSRVPGTNTNVRFIYFKQNESGNETEGLTCIHNAIAEAQTRYPSALTGSIVLTYDVGVTRLQFTAAKGLVWGIWLDALLLLEHITAVYPDWQYLFNLNVIGEEIFLGSGALIEGRPPSATA